MVPEHARLGPINSQRFRYWNREMKKSALFIRKYHHTTITLIRKFFKNRNSYFRRRINISLRSIFLLPNHFKLQYYDFVYHWKIAISTVK